MRIAVYSCVVGGYEIPKPPVSKEMECDYYLISDNRDLAYDKCTWIDVDSIVPDKTMSAKDKNRYCKMHPNIIFPQYDYTIYLDGSIQVVGKLSHYIADVGKSGLAIHRHRRSDCVYLESIILAWLGVVEKEILTKTIKKYIEVGLPRHYGMFECGMIITDINNQLARDLYKQWYEEYMIGTGRDQLDFMYTLWMSGTKKEAIGLIGGNKMNIDLNPDVMWDRKSHYKS